MLLYRDVDCVRGNVDTASMSPCANTAISTGGVSPAASSPIHFNILSAVICSPRLTHYVSFSLLTLPRNSPKSSPSHLRNPTPPLNSYVLRVYLQPPGHGLSQTVMHQFSARLWPPLYLLIISLLLRPPTAALVGKPRESIALLKNNQCTLSCAAILDVSLQMLPIDLISG